MKKNSVAVLGVVYPAADKYIKDYLASLNAQTRQDFDLIIVNNGYKAFSKISAASGLDAIEIAGAGTPAELKEIGINYIKKAGYKYVIYTDCDDTFSPNRIENSAELLNKYDIVVNDVSLMTEAGRVYEERYFSSRLNDSEEVGLDFIKDKNIFGFSNTALRTKILNEKTKLHSDLIAVDWYFFTTLLAGKHSAVFTNQATTFYRIYQGNTLGFSAKVSAEKIKIEIEIMHKHYSHLSGMNAEFKQQYARLSRLREKMSERSFEEKYVKYVGSFTLRNPLWFEEVRDVEEITA